MDTDVEGGENGRRIRVVNGLQATSTPSGGIFAESEWAGLLTDLSLPPRQSQIVRLLFAGCSDKQTAGKLGISVPTVRTHLRRLFS